MLRDLRSAWRSLAKNPGFTTVAVLALGLGLGLSTTMFAVLDAVVHPYVAYRNPERLFNVSWRYATRRRVADWSFVYRALRDETRSFDGVALLVGDRLPLNPASDGAEIWFERASPRYFDLVGVRPERGRLFNEHDAEDVALVSAGTWRHIFGGRQSLAGATLTLGERVYHVVGVLPRGIEGTAWLPLPAGSEDGAVRVGVYARAVVRLKDGVTLEQADSELVSLGRLVTARYSEPDLPVVFHLWPMTAQREEVRDIHKAMVGAALAVLLIACVNLAHLMLARGTAKRAELALRMALGASRATVTRFMLAECALITLGGAVLGALGAVWGSAVLANRMPPSVNWVGLVEPHLSWRVFALAAIAAAGSAIIFGLIPAARVAARLDVTEPLKESAGTTTGRRRQHYSPLVVAETGVALVLLMGGGLLLRTVYWLEQAPLGYEPSTLLEAFVAGTARHDSARVPTRWIDVLAAARFAPGVRDAAYRLNGPLVGGAVTAEMTSDTPRVITMLSYSIVSPSYLEVLGLPVLRGRNFEPGDANGSGVAILDAVAAEQLYPGQDPIGHMVKLGAPRYAAPSVPIVGVVRSPLATLEGDIYTRHPSLWVAQSPPDARGAAILVRMSSGSPRVAVDLRQRLRELPGVLFATVQRYDADREAALTSRRFLADVFVGMGVVALALAALGLYGVLAYAVNQRMREFGVRVALGADARQLRGMILHDGLVMLLGGIGLGAFVALAAARYLDAVLVAVLPSDVVSLVLSETVLLAVGLAAALAPARRAARANPLDILRAV
jgi:putative ABC transport system permease protein